MFEKIKNLFIKNKSIILYVFFGGVTTVLNYAVYIGCFLIYPFQKTTVPNLLAWVAAIIVAYLTNRKWVFGSKASGAKAQLLEFLKFCSSRVFSLLVETGLLFLLVDTLSFPNYVTKLVINVLVIVLNYIFSKYWVFSGKEK